MTTQIEVENLKSRGQNRKTPKITVFSKNAKTVKIDQIPVESGVTKSTSERVENDEKKWKKPVWE